MSEEKPNNVKSAKEPEDYFYGRMVERLRRKLGIHQTAISEWIESQGDHYSNSSICEQEGGSAPEYLRRMVWIRRYFQEVHGLTYVTTDYLLEGEEADHIWAQRERESKTTQVEIKQLPLLEFAQQESA